MIPHPFTKKIEELFEQVRRGNDRRPRVEGESVTLEYAGATAEVGQSIDERDAKTASAKTCRSSEPTETRADHDSVGRVSGWVYFRR